MIRTTLKKLLMKKSLIVPVLAVALGAGILVGCGTKSEAAGESGGEHDGAAQGAEGAGEHGAAGVVWALLTAAAVIWSALSRGLVPFA